MSIGLRIGITLLGVFFGLSALRWLLDPQAAAAGLGVSLPGGLGRSTIVGDLGSFFFGISAFVLAGAWTLRATWLRAAAVLLGAAALYRVLAYALHAADFAGLFIAVEVVSAGLLLYGASRLD